MTTEELLIRINEVKYAVMKATTEEKNEALEEKQFNSINATSSFLELLWDDCPYDSFISSRLTLNDAINNLSLYIGGNPEPVVDFSWNDEFEGARFHFGPTFFLYDNEFDLAAMIHFESEVDIVDEANLYTESTTDCKKLIRNFIKAELFGCSKSECESLSKEFDRIFNNDVYVPELDIDTYGNSVKFWGEFYDGSWADVKYVTRLAVGLEAKDMKWKPAFGIRPFGEPSIPIEIEGKFYSFSEIVNMPDEELDAFFKTLSELYKEGSHYIDIIW